MPWGRNEREVLKELWRGQHDWNKTRGTGRPERRCEGLIRNLESISHGGPDFTFYVEELHCRVLSMGDLIEFIALSGLLAPG